MTWVTIEETGDILTERAYVPGGWLVRCFNRATECDGSGRVNNPGIVSGVTFIPDLHHAWSPREDGGSAEPGPGRRF